MSLLHSAFVATIYLGLATSKPHHWNCHEFSRGVKFEDNQAVGTWILLRMKTESINTLDNSHCVDFHPVDEEERKDLEDQIGQYVENMEWKNLTLKMQIPCAQANATRRVRYYLEKLEEPGSYRTLQMPATTAKFDLAEFQRYPMRLKFLEGRYLYMLDCVDRVGFLMGRQPDADERLSTLIDAFWPDEGAPINQV